MTVQRPEPRLWVNDSHGQYIPQIFTTTLDRARVAEINDEDWTIIEAGPDHDEYWDAWQEIELKAIVTLDDGLYRIFQQSDCWLIPVGMEWDHERDWFVWPEAKEQVDE